MFAAAQTASVAPGPVVYEKDGNSAVDPEDLYPVLFAASNYHVLDPISPVPAAASESDVLGESCPVPAAAASAPAAVVPGCG